MLNNAKINFRSLTIEDIAIILNWFNAPHIQQFYSLKTWTESDVRKKLLPIISHDKPIFAFIVTLENNPIGYLQYYCVKDFPWPNQSLTDDILPKTAGLDFFIGDIKFVGRGLGALILKKFIKKTIWPDYDYCMVDPDNRNQAMIRCCQKAGFLTHKIIKTEDALKRSVTLNLMIMKKDNL